MSQIQRLNFVNNWPNTVLFQAEIDFDRQLQRLDKNPPFQPYPLPAVASKDAHITISFLIDALSALPRRPDHAFDWIWRAFESIIIHHAPGNITQSLRDEACPEVLAELKKRKSLESAFFELVSVIPHQSCEYLFKNIKDGAPYAVSTGVEKLSKYAKRLLLSNGSGSIISHPLQYFLATISNRYDYANPVERRKAAMFLRRALNGQILSVDKVDVALSLSDRLLLLISGLSYTFRNDRAHANSIAPFQSSLASVKTYAHCWFMFLLVYQLLITYLHRKPAIFPFANSPDENFVSNTNIFVSLFGRHINQ